MKITMIKHSILLYSFTLLMCFFISSSVAPADSNYTFETIDVEGVDFLALTASSDFDDYAGYTRRPADEKMVGFTLIDGVFETYDFPGAQNTYFYALANNGDAAGYYEDSEGLSHGVILENGELREWDFEGSVQTEIYHISDEMGALTGNFVDTSGVRRGFSGDTIIELPNARETYAHFTLTGAVTGSYVDAEGVYHGYARISEGRFSSFDLVDEADVEFLVVPGYNDAGFGVYIAQAVGDVPRTYVGRLSALTELRVPHSISTAGWNINQDGSVVGYYDTADGGRHGFVARPTAPVDDPRAVDPDVFNYSFESIDVPSVDFLALTASSDFEDYAGNTPSGDKMVGFTLIDGVFKTHDFPGAQNTYFYALSNTGIAAGHYEDSDGLYHGAILEDGEFRQYDFPGAVQTFIHGLSDATGALTGNFIDASGVRRGFTGDQIIEYPGARETYAEFVNAEGLVVGSYVDADGVWHAFGRAADGRFLTVDLPGGADLEYFSYHGISDDRLAVARARAVGDVPRTYVGRFNLYEVKFPGSVSTEGWNINQDGSIVGHYDSVDGRRHGFIARPTSEAVSDYFGNVFNVKLAKGLNMISVPLAPPTPMTAKSLAALTGATTVIALDAKRQEFVGWTPSAPNDGFSIEGGKGYIVNVPEARQFAFVGSEWTNQTEDAAAAPAIFQQQVWAFVVSGHLKGRPAFDGYQVIVRNVRTNSAITASVEGDYFAAATADLSRRSVVEVGDVIEVRVIGPGGNVESRTFSYQVTPESIADAVLSIRLDSIGQPRLTQLLQNFPNPFNPETWIPYRLAEDAHVTLTIYDLSGRVVRSVDVGHQVAAVYEDRSKAIYFDGRNSFGEPVASGVYFYHLSAGDYSATRKMLILK